MFMPIKFSYLRNLDRPEEAIAPGYWDHIRATLLNRLSLKNILEQDSKKLSKKLGILWIGNSESLKNILNKDIRTIKKKNLNYRKQSILLVFKLFELEDQELEKLYEKSQEEINKEFLNKYLEEKKKRILYKIRKTRTNINFDTDFELMYKELLKTIVTEIIAMRTIKTNNYKLYAYLFIYRFYGGYTLKQISEKRSLPLSQISQMIFTIKREFNKIFPNYEDKQDLAKEWEKLYSHVFNILDDSDLEKRSQRLQKMKLFQRKFIAKNLKQYID